VTVAVLVAPQYADVAHVRTHAPPRVNPYGKYRECLRIDFAFTCVYCLSTEREVAPTDNFGAFEIDHFRPQTSFRRLRSSYSNLLWSCHACNRAKGDNWPTAAELAQGMRFPDPCYDAMSTQIRLAGS